MAKIDDIRTVLLHQLELCPCSEDNICDYCIDILEMIPSQSTTITIGITDEQTTNANVE